MSRGSKRDPRAARQGHRDQTGDTIIPDSPKPLLIPPQYKRRARRGQFDRVFILDGAIMRLEAEGDGPEAKSVGLPGPRGSERPKWSRGRRPASPHPASGQTTPRPHQAEERPQNTTKFLSIFDREMLN